MGLMEHDELDRKLRKLTASEEAYREHPYLSEKYNSIKQIEYNGQKVFVFYLEGGKIKITKHSRFAEVPMHIHNDIEMNYVYSGQCTQIINDQTVTLTEGQICIVDTGAPHAILATGENDIIVNISMSREYFSTSFLSRLSSHSMITDFLVNAISDNQTHNRYIIFHSENSRKLGLFIRELLCEYYDQSLCSEEMIDCYMVLIFSELLRVFQFDTNQKHAKSSSHPSVIEILHYLEENFQTCTLASTAEHFNFHPNYLSALLKKSTGRSFKQLILTHRMTRSSLLLSNTDTPVYHIAADIGYDNLSFFYRKFKDYFGVTPNEYREQHKA